MCCRKECIKDIVLGVDIPIWAIDYNVNKDKIKLADNDEAVLGGHLIWALVKSGRVNVYGFDSIKKDGSDCSFGKILVELNKLTGLSTENDYEETFNTMVDRKLMRKEKIIMFSNCYNKIGNALATNTKLALVNK